MSEARSIAVIDDGDLADVCSVLEELGADFAHWGKLDVPDTGWEPGRLLVISASLATSTRYRRAPEKTSGRPIWMVVASDDAGVARDLLLRAGFDYLVRMPVHAAALRLLFRAALWSGREQREGMRVAVGYPVRYRTHWWHRKGTLVDLSPGGCRLLCNELHDPGTRVSVRIPRAFAEGSAFDLQGTVLRARRAELEGGSSKEMSLAVRFDALGEALRARLHGVLAALVRGPAVERWEEPEPPESDPERRQHLRGPYRQPVPVFGDAETVLVGRDLSQRGMRVDPHPALEVGEHVRLSIEGGGLADPVLVQAGVARDDGAEGMALHFDWIEPGGSSRLDEIVRALPRVEALEPRGERRRLFFSQLLPRLLRIGGRRRG